MKAFSIKQCYKRTESVIIGSLQHFIVYCVSNVFLSEVMKYAWIVNVLLSSTERLYNLMEKVFF